MRRSFVVFVLACSALFCAAAEGQEPRILQPRTFRTPGGWFSISVPADWKEKSDSELGRRTYRFAPEADSEDAGKMEMGVALLTEWQQRQVTEQSLQAATTSEIQRLKDDAAKQGRTVVVRDKKTVILARQSAMEFVVDETGKDGKQTTGRWSILPSVVHTYVIWFRFPKEESESLTMQFDRMVQTFAPAAPPPEAVDEEKLKEYSDGEMAVAVQHPDSWQTKATGEGSERRIVIAPEEALEKGPDPCPAVVIQKVTEAGQGKAEDAEGTIIKRRDLYVKQLEAKTGKVILHPGSSLARLGGKAALAYKLEFAQGGESRYALLVISVEKDTLVQVFLVAPAETFYRHAPLFGRMLSTMKAFQEDG